MATNDFRVKFGFDRHPKTKLLIKTLGAEAAWYLVRLWAWAADNRPNGMLVGLTDEAIELAVDWPGEEGRFVKELAIVRFIDGLPGERSLHDWAEHQPWISSGPERSERSRRASRARWSCDRPTVSAGADDPTSAERPRPIRVASGEDASRMQSACVKDATGSDPQCPVSDSSSDPSSTSQPESLVRATEASPPLRSPAATLAAAMRQAGCPDADEFHPGIQAAIVEGLPAGALTALLGTEKGRGKSAAYVVAAVRGRRSDAPSTIASRSLAGPPPRAERIDPLRAPEDHETAARKMREHLLSMGAESPIPFNREEVST